MKNTAIIVMSVGIVLFAIGLFLKTPSTELTTYSFKDSGKYSVIDEYVGGDAYNYIIGASLVAGKISGRMAMKAIFIAAGSINFCMGLIFFEFVKRTGTSLDSQQMLPDNNENNSPEQ